MELMDKNIGGYLQEAFQRGRAAHAYIVVGEKQRLPQLLLQCAKVCMCASNTGEDGCEVCNKVQAGLHQDVLTFPKDSAKAKLTVADMAILVEESYKRPIDASERRVFLLDASNSVAGISADTWQNKLLKTLEEPTDNIHIFIGVTDAEGLLPTIRSRCQILKQSQFSVGEIFAALQQKGYEKRFCEVAASISSDADSAEAVLANTAIMRAFNNACDVLQNMTSSKNALKYISLILSEKETVSHCLNFMMLLLRESIVYRLAENLCIFPSYTEVVQTICANYSLQAAEVCIEKINFAKRRLDDGGNLTVVIDQLASSVLEVRFRCRI